MKHNSLVEDRKFDVSFLPFFFLSKNDRSDSTTDARLSDRGTKMFEDA